ncbi:Uncharacterized membrane protein [Parafrankia irregularis]|uniref:Uncharacterized membrane protein n=1 Tax=Parafrankia irregularis TaxID=795642 RepID=A0A0S4R046_9ACTN|nr:MULTISPECIES: DUF1003 domain-containing protein [Parafrankia]MBE3205157.1 DUF1003 domain-containing protein [Parafrankia sp. CH37]CUU61213.1 Uncharacterized membrane protein [Parafrankia irregularis]
MIGLLRRRAGRLDQPHASRRVKVRPSYEPDAFGRVAERIARFLGTARFIAVQTVVIVLWVVYNIVAPASVRFDNYPFIFLTLALSLQAAYAAPLILLAQNRQDDRDRANLAQDREASVRLQDDTGYLARELAAMRISIGDLASRDFLRSELRVLLADLDGGGSRAEKSRKDKRERRRRQESVPSAHNGAGAQHGAGGKNGAGGPARPARTSSSGGTGGSGGSGGSGAAGGPGEPAASPDPRESS